MNSKHFLPKKLFNARIKYFTVYDFFYKTFLDSKTEQQILSIKNTFFTLNLPKKNVLILFIILEIEFLHLKN